MRRPVKPLEALKRAVDDLVIWSFVAIVILGAVVQAIEAFRSAG